MFKLALTVSLVFLILAIPVNAFEYKIEYFDDAVGSGTDQQTDPPAFDSNNGVSGTLIQTPFLAGNTTRTYDIYYWSPYTVNYAWIDDLSLSSNSTCYVIGPATKTYASQDNIEGYNTMTQSGPATNSWLYTRNAYTITTTERFINISSHNEDSSGWSYNLYNDTGTFAGSAPSITDVTDNLNSDNWGQCATQLVSHTAGPTMPVTAGNQRQYAYMVFNSTAGNVSRLYINTYGQDLRVVVYPLDNPGGYVYTTLPAGNTLTTSLSLDSHTVYVVGVGYEHGSQTTIPRPIIEVNIDLGIADYECGDWSECTDAVDYYYRECVDLNGFQPNKIENLPCSPTILENATLGFEGYHTVTDVWKCSPSYYTFDPYYLNETDRDTPINWTIGETAIAKRDFLKMTTEWSTEGSRSLKMWYIPPKMWEVSLNSTGYPVDCGNATSGVVPSVTQNMSNDSYSVRYNVSFPTDNMILRFDVKGCEEQVLQHSAVYLYFPFTTIVLDETYPEMCYAGTCNGTPNSRYVVNMLDAVTGTSIFGYAKFGEAYTNFASTDVIDLSNLGILPGRNYTLVFSVYPENFDDTGGNCVYFDNVRFESIEQPYVDTILSGVCETQCVGDDYFEATLLSNGECSVRVIELGCISENILEELRDGNDYCKDTNTLIQINERTTMLEELSCQYGCSNGACLTEEQATDPTQSSDSMATDAIGFFEQPFTWAILVTLAVMLLVAMLLGAYKVKDAGIIALGMGLITNIFFIVAEWTPFWWGLMISAGLIVLIANMITKHSGGG